MFGVNSVIDGVNFCNILTLLILFLHLVSSEKYLTTFLLSIKIASSFFAKTISLPIFFRKFTYFSSIPVS